MHDTTVSRLPEDMLSGSIRELSRRVDRLDKSFDRIKKQAEMVEVKFDRHLKRMNIEIAIIDVLEALRHRDKRYARYFFIILHNIVTQVGHFMIKLQQQQLEGTGKSQVSQMMQTHRMSVRLKQILVGPIANTGDEEDMMKQKQAICDEFMLAENDLYLLSVVGDLISWPINPGQQLKKTRSMLTSEMLDVVHLVEDNIKEGEHKELLAFLFKLLDWEKGKVMKTVEEKAMEDVAIPSPPGKTRADNVMDCTGKDGEDKAGAVSLPGKTGEGLVKNIVEKTCMKDTDKTSILRLSPSSIVKTPAGKTVEDRERNSTEEGTKEVVSPSLNGNAGAERMK